MIEEFGMENIITRKVKDSLRESLTKALLRCRDQGILAVAEIPEISLEVPKDKINGNYATNLAMVLTKQVKKPPREIAGILVEQLSANPYLADVKVAGAGFINFYLNTLWLGEVLQSILAAGDDFGRNLDMAGAKIQLEFVSANPVGPMNVVNARAAALGDSLGRLFSACGAEVQREYYVNDHGVQVWTLGRSIEARYRELLGQPVEFPEEGYQGEYIYDMAKALIADKKDDYLKLSEEQRIEAFRDWGYQQILASQKTDLANYGVNYDCWFSERSLHQDGTVAKVMQELIDKGLTYEADGALWLRTTDYGDDKDRVLRTADGRTTYFTSDIAYHINKFGRGFHRVIDIWGPDHHGYIPRMKAAMAAVGIDPDRLEVLIAQQINLLKDGQPFKMSKRRGEFITMTDLLEDVGNDAARWFFLMRSPESHLDFDLDLAKSQTNENPVFYVQYAHARICSIFRQAVPDQLDFSNSQDLIQFWDEEEALLIEKAAQFPDLISDTAKRREPHRLTGYLLELASLFHSYYNRRRFISEERETTRARLALACSIRHIFKHGLEILGVSAPEKM